MSPRSQTPNGALHKPKPISAQDAATILVEWAATYEEARVDVEGARALIAADLAQPAPTTGC